MPNEQAVLDVAGLLSDSRALSEAVLAGDLQEARFRARLAAGRAGVQVMKKVEVTASELVRLLGHAGQPPLPGYAQAVLDLSAELDEAMTALLTCKLARDP